MIGDTTIADVPQRLTQPAKLHAGLAVTSASPSSGFIWAFEWRNALVFAAALFARLGYAWDHYTVTGSVVDAAGNGSGASRLRSLTGLSGRQHARMVVGFGLLVTGMVIGVEFINRGNHLLTNIGGVLFPGGYVVAHCAGTGKPL